MSFSRVNSAQTSGLQGEIVSIETDISNGLHNFSIVGLPDKSVEEARDRVSSAIKNSGLKSPKQTNQKIVVSLFPANIKKEGSYFDLPIALGYLLSNKDIEFDPDKKIFIGELSLNGELRSVRGVLPITKTAKELGFEEIYVPDENKKEAALISGIKVYGIKNLKEIIKHLDKNVEFSFSETPETEINFEEKKNKIDFSEIRGQEYAKRALEIAAAGGHNLCMYGPPGTGKTMLARAFSSILPNMTKEEILEVTSIHSISGVLKEDLVLDRPFRSPHSTSSYVSVIGGGAFPKPGEVTLAHRGVLFLDEFPEFDRRVLESLRQPLEDRIVQISRSKGTSIFPTNFILIAAMNPPDKKATAGEIERYKRKISGPIMDRIDMWVNVPKIDHELLSQKSEGEKTESVRKRINLAREKQKERFANEKFKTNSEMGVRQIDRYVKMSQEVKDLLNDSARKLNISPRVYHRIIKLARTIADIEGSESIKNSHLLEAISFRPKEIEIF